MNTQEGNKIIAEFMGVSIVKRNDEDAVYCFDGAAYPEYFRCTRFNTYHEDWNALMPVIDKIEKLGFPVSINEWNTNIGNFRLAFTKVRHDEEGTLTKIQFTYNVIMDFIQWYNTHHKQIKGDK